MMNTQWQSGTIGPWIAKIRNYRLGIVVLALVIIGAAFSFGGLSYSFKIDNISSETMGNLVVGIVLAMGGTWLFGAREIGLFLTRLSVRRLWIVSIFLFVTLFLNGFFAPSKSVALANFDVVKVSVTGFWEELLFRGFLFALWAKLFGLRTPVSILLLLLTSSLIFGLFHSNEGLDLFIRSGLGFLFGVIVLFTESVLFAIPLHALHNGLIMIMVYEHNPPDWSKVSVMTIMCIAGFIVLFYAKMREDSHSRSKAI